MIPVLRRNFPAQKYLLSAKKYLKSTQIIEKIEKSLECISHQTLAKVVTTEEMYRP